MSSGVLVFGFGKREFFELTDRQRHEPPVTR